jgi:hypothetical protein
VALLILTLFGLYATACAIPRIEGDSQSRIGVSRNGGGDGLGVKR